MLDIGASTPLFGITALLLMRGVASDLEAAGLSWAIGVESAIDAVLSCESCGVDVVMQLG